MTDRRIFKYAEPPLELQDKGKWEPLQYYVERVHGGGVLKVACPACGSVFWGRWDVVKAKEGQDLVVPVLEGGLIHQDARTTLACLCPGGRKWVKRYPLISELEFRRLREQGTQPGEEPRQITPTEFSQALVQIASPPNIRKAIEFLALENDPAAQRLEEEQKRLVAGVHDESLTVGAGLAAWHVAIAEMLEAARKLWRSRQADSKVTPGT